MLRNFLLSALPPADLAAMRPHLTEINLHSGQVLYEPGELVETVYFPTSAVFSVVTVMEDGRSVESATVGRESVVGLLLALSGEAAASRTFIQIPGGALRMSASKLRERAAQSTALLQVVLRFAQANIAHAEQSVACNALHDVTARLCRWLLLCQDRTGSDMLPLTQEYLSIMVGVQRTTVSAAASALKAAGLIRYSRGKIEVLDREGLKRAACECYGVVHANFERLLPVKA